MNPNLSRFLPTGNFLIECEVDICEDAHDPLQEVCGVCGKTKGEHIPPQVHKRKHYECPYDNSKDTLRPYQRIHSRDASEQPYDWTDGAGVRAFDK